MISGITQWNQLLYQQTSNMMLSFHIWLDYIAQESLVNGQQTLCNGTQNNWNQKLLAKLYVNQNQPSSLIMIGCQKRMKRQKEAWPMWKEQTPKTSEGKTEAANIEEDSSKWCRNNHFWKQLMLFFYCFGSLLFFCRLLRSTFVIKIYQEFRSVARLLCSSSYFLCISHYTSQGWHNLVYFVV